MLKTARVEKKVYNNYHHKLIYPLYEYWRRTPGGGASLVACICILINYRIPIRTYSINGCCH